MAVESNEQLLRRIVAAEKAIAPQVREFRVTRIEKLQGARVMHAGFRSPDVLGRSETRVPRQLIEELAERDLIRLRKQTVRTSVASPVTGVSRTAMSERWSFDVLPSASLEVKRLDALAAPPGEAFDISWAAIEPVLLAVYAAYATAPMLGLGVSREAINDALGRSHDDASTDRALHELVRTDWLCFDATRSRSSVSDNSEPAPAPQRQLPPTRYRGPRPTSPRPSARPQ